MDNKAYTTLVQNYHKALSKAGNDIIPAGDKSKLLKLLEGTLEGLKVAGNHDNFVTINNALTDEITKLAVKFKKFNDSVKKNNKDLDAAVKICDAARSVASSQKGFDKSKELKDMPSQLEHVSDWLSIAHESEMNIVEFASAVK